MIAVHFNKDRAEHFLESLANGESIQPTELGWTVFDMLALAGACYFCAMSHGPALYQQVDISTFPKERREAVNDTFQRDLSAAVEVLGLLAMRVQDREFDEQFEPHVEALVTDDDGKKHVRFIRGYRAGSQRQ